MRKNIVAGNWKMNLLVEEANDLANSIGKYISENVIDSNIEVILAPPALYLDSLVNNTKHLFNLNVAAQNCYQAPKGAFTGEISAPMLKSVGVKYVIIGHSERRLCFGEDNETLKQKVSAVLDNHLQPIFCCGEQESERDAGNHKAFIESQLIDSLFHLSASELAKCVIAYEPIWAIGTGKTASPEQAQEIHQFIRELIAKKYDDATANNITILYGGSCKPSNAKELFSQKDVDGGLIGGASLLADQFVDIIDAF
ncbi:MAG: triose-phosphate isomerase [Chitinophagales bacterium]